MTEQVRSFRTKLKEVPVTIEGEDGLFHPYVVTQIPSDEVCAFKNWQHSKYELNAETNKLVCKDFTDLESYLVAKALRTNEPGQPRKAVPIATINKWPDGTVSELYSIAEELMSEHQDAKEEAKND